MAVLPLLVSDDAVGVLALYAGETGFFDEEEMKLLTELAGDIAFAIENISRQQKLDKLARIRAVSSEINAAIVRIHDREALLRETCRIAVEHGKFELVWVAALDQEKQKVQPVAWTGFSPDAAHAVSWASISAARGTLGEAILTRKPAVRNDIRAELPVGKLRQEALQKGCRSTVCLPLVVDDNVVALIVLFAPGVGFFDEEELALLNEVAANVSFALQAIEKEEKLDYLAYYDVLTGLANRSLFHNRLAHSLHARDGEHRLIATVLLDLERFRRVNETLGRNSGDELLKEVGSRLLRANDTAARIGVDMYGLILRGARTAAEMNRALEAILAACFTEPFALGNEELRVACRAGVALHPTDGADADALLRNAEAAVRRSKGSGDRIVFYAPGNECPGGRGAGDRDQTAARHRAPGVRAALSTQGVTGERPHHRSGSIDPMAGSDKGLVPPGHFIPVLEETGMIVEVGRWVVEQAFVDLRAWAARGISVPRVAVNVSAIQLQSKDFVDSMIDEIRRGGDAPEWLELEITESAVMAQRRGQHPQALDPARHGYHGRDRRFRHRLFVAQLSVQTAGGHAEDRPLLRERHDCRAGGTGAGVHHHSACPRSQAEGGGRGRRDRGAVAHAQAAEVRRNAGLLIQQTGAGRDLRNKIPGPASRRVTKQH